MDNIWFQYKIGKQLDELEIEDSLCLSLFKSLENCIKFKKLSNIGLKEAEIKRDAEISRWHTELLREKNLKEQRRQKEEQEKKSQENFQKFLEFCKQQNRVLKKFDNTNFSFECDEPATKKPLENPTNNILNSNHQNKGYSILTFGMIIMTKETYEAYLDTNIKQLEEIRNQKLNKALELCKQSGLVLRKFDGKNFSFECDEPNRSKL